MAVADTFAFMGDLLAYGVPVPTVLEEGAATTPDRSLARALREVGRRVRRGERLSDAVTATGAFSAAAVSAVIAAEQTGTLPAAFGEIAAHAKQDAELVAQIRNRLGYPAFVASVGVGIGGVITLGILPRIAQALSGLASLPPLTRLVLSGAAHGAPVALGGGGLLAGGLVGLALWYRADPVGVWRLVWRCPLLGPALRNGLLARFFANVAVFLRNGIPVLEALDGGRKGLRNPALHQAVDEVRGAMSRGAGLAQALAHPLFPRVVQLAAARGEETGRTEKYLDDLARMLAREMLTRVGRLTTWIERGMLLAVAGFILFMALAFLLPIYGGLQQLTPYH